MQKVKFLLSLCTLYFVLCTFVYAQTVDNQLIDATNKEIEKSLQFKQFSSCKEIDKVLGKYIDEFKNNLGNGGIMMERQGSSAAQPMAADSKGNAGSMMDYSTTNVQKAGVDEPEIIKTDGKYIYYFNQNENKIYAVSSPLNSSNAAIDLNSVRIMSIINIPSGFYNVKLFVSKNRLVILASKTIQMNNYATTSILNRGETSALAIYDTTDLTHPKLLKLTDVDGYFNDARLIGNKLYVISQLAVNRYNYTPYKTKSSDLLPKATDTVNKKAKSVTPVCNQISYVLPSKDAFNNFNSGPGFVIISTVDISNSAKATTMTVVLADAGQIHMSTKSLYLLQNLYFYNPWPCRTPQLNAGQVGRLCMMPVYSAGEQSLIHKFTLIGDSLKYQKSNLIPGTLLNQYSMDEDGAGNFRILTQKRNSEPGTNFYTLDKNLSLKGKLEKIATGEQFKSSRFLGDKLYLVSFHQIDPLFVIDIANITKPKIIGELKVPGYSTYLHPLGNPTNAVQYLIGLGYDTATNSRGGTINSGIKLSLYEVNYKEKDPSNPDYIKITERSSLSIGGEGSRSEALDNPRLFVIDKKNTVSLPLFLQSKSTNGQNCNIEYSSTGAEVSKNCRPIEQFNPTFAGIKSYSVDISNGIKEVFSKDYSDLFKKIPESPSSRSIQGSNMRVGYMGESLYVFDNYFAHFVMPANGQEKYLDFSDELKK